jgi:hypothetical protein
LESIIKVPGVFAGLVAAQLIRIELTARIRWSFIASMGRQEWPDVKSEQDDILDEQARLLFITELAESIVIMRGRAKTMDSRELEDSLASPKAAYCYWREIFLEVEMSKGPTGFGLDVAAYLNLWSRLSKC